MDEDAVVCVFDVILLASAAVPGALNQAKCAAALAAKQGQIAGFVALLSVA